MVLNQLRFSETLTRGSVEHSINTEQELSVELLRQPATAKEGSLETYLSKQIASRKGIRPFRLPNAANAAGNSRCLRSIHTSTRRLTRNPRLPRTDLRTT
ncbi:MULTISPECIES: hypothetical protein [Prochlorococcus]|uniref:hypothetical protein n=1 Tax=Prochlorococcus TaxID=1218 RepID=UPI0007B3A0F4|nr:hypothetical protein [Prochlorococcus marinus]